MGFPFFIILSIVVYEAYSFRVGQTVHISGFSKSDSAVNQRMNNQRGEWRFWTENVKFEYLQTRR